MPRPVSSCEPTSDECDESRTCTSRRVGPREMSSTRVRRMEAAHTGRIPRFDSQHVPSALKGTTLARLNGRVESYMDNLVEAFQAGAHHTSLLSLTPGGHPQS